MPRHSSGDDERIARAREAADQIFDDPYASPGPSFVPNNAEEARAAVERLGERFEGLAGTAKIAFDGARKSGILLSSDPLQGLSEIIQNADDAEASEVRLLLQPSELLATHNGLPVHLKDVHGLATPWLSTKADEESTIGRFGIGLSTLQALSATLEVYCFPYHVRVGDPTIAPVEPADMPPRFCEPGWTTLRIPLQDEMLQRAQLEEWFDSRGDSFLLFLRHVARVILLEPDGSSIRELALSRLRDVDLPPRSELPEISQERAATADGRSWAIYSARVPTPSDVERTNKKSGSTTPISVAIPLEPTKTGQIYAGLPVAPTHQPLFANAQFDPVTSRADFAPTSWNEALVNLVSDVWSEAVLNLFARDPQAAWQSIPLPRDGDGVSQVVQSLESAVVEKARQVVASRLSFPVHGQGHVSLSQLAVEAVPLEGVLNDAETAHLAGLSATLPIELRDPGGKWRLVLDDWRSHGADLPEEVSVGRALDLVDDEGRPVSSTIALVAAALDEGLSSTLLNLPCIIDSDGRRLVPPARNPTKAVSTGTSPLAERLGITARLHSEYLNNTNGAPEILDWLGECGALLDVSDDREVVHRIARAGRSGNTINTPLADEQVRALRDAFERIDQDERQELGPDVGRAIRLKSYTYNTEGRKTRDAARPADAYLPRSIASESDGFAVAANRTMGIVWLSDHYSRALRSQEGRDGIGAIRFLRLLGAETAPRLQPHTGLEQKYQSWSRNDARPGLPQAVTGGPEARISAMRQLGATYSLEDYDSPDLRAVMINISREHQGEQRRIRARALLAALDRAWDRCLSDFAEVVAASSDYRWVLKGSISAFWLWQAKDIAWLDDESGTARKPVELLIRTPDTEAIFGKNSPDYLHADLNQHIRHDLLIELGVSSDPSRTDLVERLRQIKAASSEDEVPPEEPRRESALVYQALARNLDNPPSDSDLTTKQLRQEFDRSQLVLTNLGWKPPQSVLKGPPIFEHLRAFAPAIQKCDPLWGALWLRAPSPEDCLEVLGEVASQQGASLGATEEAIMLDTLRVLAKHYEGENSHNRPAMAALDLWTSKGWTRDRPVYATDDPILTAGLGDRLPIWRPGGELEQFQSLLEPLCLTEIQASGTSVINPELAQDDRMLTELFQRAIEQLRNDLQRNDERLAQSLTLSWDSLATYVVRVHPSLTLKMEIPSGQEYDCEVNAKIDSARSTVFVSEPAVLARVDGGGRALAALFNGGVRRVAQAWGASCELAEAGIEAHRIELARERAEREEAELSADNRLAKLQEQTAKKLGSSQDSDGHRAAGGVEPSHTATDQRKQRRQHPPRGPSRTLVDPQSLLPTDPGGRMDVGSSNDASDTGRRPTRGGGLSDPKSGLSGSSSSTRLRGYTDVQKEKVGLELLQMLLSTDENEIADLRDQRGVGADAVDKLQRFFELKVYAGAEPNEVMLTDSEVQRALTTSDFFLVVISNVEEGADGPTTVRIVTDPLEQLHPTDRGTITLSGVRDATSLVYEFAPTDSQQALDEEK